MGRMRKSEVLRYLGYGGQEVDPSLDARLDAACVLCEEACAPRRLWRVFALDAFEPGRARRVQGTTLELPGLSMERYLARASSVALLACTLGASSERRLRVLAANDPLGQMLFDAACSAMVEAEADEACAEIDAWAQAQGLRSGERFSPGYGDLPLEVQPLFLNVLQAPRLLGVCATADNLLVPAKSITALVGLFPNTADPAPLGCLECRLFDTCALRLRGTPCQRASHHQ